MFRPGASEAVAAVEVKVDVLAEHLPARYVPRAVGGEAGGGVKQNQPGAGRLAGRPGDDAVDPRVGAKRQGVQVAGPLEMLAGGDGVCQVQQAITPVKLNLGA